MLLLAVILLGVLAVEGAMILLTLRVIWAQLEIVLHAQSRRMDAMIPDDVMSEQFSARP